MTWQSGKSLRYELLRSSLRTQAVILALLSILLTVAAGNCSAQVAETTAPPTSSNGIPAPLTGKERWHLYENDNFLSSGIYFASFGSALGAQSSNEPREWGGGFAGYGRRAASQYGLFAIQNTLHDGGAAALGYEPRYFRCQCTGLWRRSGHALEMSFLTYNEHGHKSLDLPQLVGAYGSGMISALWYPKRYSPLVQGVQAGHMQMGFVVGTHLIQEFSPELKHTWPITEFVRRGSPKDD